MPKRSAAHSRSVRVARVLLALMSLFPLGHGQAATHVPVERRGSLQEELDRATEVVLDDDADYGALSATPLVLRSGQSIRGGWNTLVPRLEIPGGVSHVRITSVRGAGRDAADIVFTGGEPNDDVVIAGDNGGRAGGAGRLKVEMLPGSRINRLSLSEFGGLRIHHERSGYVRDSLFDRFLSYWRGPVLLWRGNQREPSGGNLFVGFSVITPQSGAEWYDVGPMWLVGADCETWNGGRRGSVDCLVVDGATDLVSIGLSGGTAVPADSGALARLSRVDRLATFFLRGHGGDRSDADILLDRVGSWINVQDEGVSRRVDTRAPAGSRRIDVASARPAGADGAIDTKPGRSLSLPVGLRAGAWPRPTRREIVDPAPEVLGSGQDHPDSAARLQARLDADRVVRLESGVYYLARPLEIGTPGRMEGLVAPAGRPAVLVAMGDFPIIKGRPHQPSLARPAPDTRLVLSNLTLYGGSHGIRWSAREDDLGPDATVAWSTFSGLSFLHQRVAAVEVVGITGIDSNLWQHVDVRDVPVAFRGAGHGSGPGMNYADKQAFVDCQFQHVAGAVWDWISDRPSGGEQWWGDFFDDVGALSRTRAAVGLIWYNVVVHDVHGPKAIQVIDRGTTATYYFTMLDSLWSGTGPAVVTDTQSSGIGTLFVNTTFGQRGGTLVARDGRQSLSSWGSVITGSAQPGSVDSGVFIDSRLGPYDRHVQWVSGGHALRLEDANAAVGRR